MKKTISLLIKVLSELHLPILRWVSFARYFYKFKKWPNMKNPKSINEKVLWLEFFTDTTEWTRLSDKYQVREFIKEKGLENILVKLYQGGITDVNEINFDCLPQSFVVKCNNGYGTVKLVKDKNSLDINAFKTEMREWLNSPFGYLSGEPHYTKIKPCIIIEELLPIPENEVSLIDYKFWCLNGNPHFCMTCSNRNIEKHRADFCYYELPSWIRKAGKDRFKSCNEIVVPKPQKLELMINYAKILSSSFPSVRVDFYEVAGKIYFGEMTFTPNGGRESDFTDELLLEMGETLDLSGVQKCK